MTFEKYFGVERKKYQTANKLTVALLIVYLLVLVWILLLKFGVQFSYMEIRSVNLIPFKDALLSTRAMDLGEIILNVVIFVPLGIYTGVLRKRWSLKNKLFFFFILSLLFEALQFILRIGAFDVTDLITNTSGGVVGLIIFEVLESLFKTSLKTQKFINLVAAIGTLFMISLLVLLKLNLLPVKYQ